MKKKIFIFVLCLSIISFSSFSVFAESNSYNWYCKRNNEHLQPKIDKDIAFIENYDVYYVDKNHGDNCENKVIYLTFDAGYENGNISKILDVLKSENVGAAFFVLKHLIQKNPELILRMEQEGHIVGNHTSNHKDISSIDKETVKAEIENLELLYKNLTGKEMKKYFRPPEGRFNEEGLKNIKELGYKTIFWSFAYADWDNNNQMSKELAKEKIFNNIHNGEIMLLHPTSKTNADILKEVIITLKQQGYTFGTLDDLAYGR